MNDFTHAVSLTEHKAKSYKPAAHGLIDCYFWDTHRLTDACLTADLTCKLEFACTNVPVYMNVCKWTHLYSQACIHVFLCVWTSASLLTCISVSPDREKTKENLRLVVLIETLGALKNIILNGHSYLQSFVWWAQWSIQYMSGCLQCPYKKRPCQHYLCRKASF